MRPGSGQPVGALSAAPHLRHEGDNFIYECAAHFNATYIVTHNLRDCARVEIIGTNVQAITPGDFCRILPEEPA